MSTLAQHRGLLGASAALFAVSAATTILWCGSMSAMPGMDMPGDWTMSMAWMRMPGQSWLGAAAAFLGMWCVMMVAMMLPVLAPMLMHYRLTGWLTISVATAYFFTWFALGVVAYPVGVALAEMGMRFPALARGVPLAVGMIVLMAGALQFSPWKARQLSFCRAVPPQSMPAGGIVAFRHGLKLGIHCIHCCLGFTTILLVLGVMDLRAMAGVTLAITLERLAPAGRHWARGTGACALAGGVWMIAGAIG